MYKADGGICLIYFWMPYLYITASLRLHNTVAFCRENEFDIGSWDRYP